MQVGEPLVEMLRVLHVDGQRAVAVGRAVAEAQRAEVRAAAHQVIDARAVDVFDVRELELAD